MLDVFPLRNDEEQKSICEEIGAEYLEGLRAYAAALDENPIAICRFTLTDEGGEICALDSLPSADFRTLFVLLRATLSFIELCGGERGFLVADIQNKELISAVGFKEDEGGRLTIDLR